MQDQQNVQVPSPGNIPDFSSSLGSFVMLSKQGKFFCLKSIGISQDFMTLAPSFHPADINILYPMVARIKASKILLVIHPGKSPQAYYLMDLKAGAAKKTVKVFEETEDVISGIVEDGALPVLLLGELEKAVGISRARKTPLSIPVRLCELKVSVPESWIALIRELFLANADAKGNRFEGLGESTRKLRSAVKQTMLEYLSKCVWLDAELGTLGMLSVNADGVEMVPFDSYDPQLSSFLTSLKKDEQGRVIAENEIGFVNAEMIKSHPWVCPTLAINNDKFKQAYHLDDYYSLYNGFKAISAHGAPVLIYTGGDLLAQNIPVRFLRVSGAMGDLLQYSMREFTGRDLVWTRQP